MIKFRHLLITALIAITAFQSSFSEDQQDVPSNANLGIEDQVGKQLPLDLTFTNSKGEKVKLKEIIDKPTVLSLVYYRCPGICSPLLSAMGHTMEQMDLVPGKDYEALTISFNHDEGYDLAAGKKRNYLEAMEKPFPASAWTWMVGDSLSIAKLTDAAGFHFQRSADGNYVHSGALIILMPDGRISRYLYGTTFLPADMELALREAKEGKSNPTISKLLAWCFGKSDPDKSGFVVDVTKVTGSVIFLSLGIFLTVLIVKGRRKKKNNEERS